MISSDGMLQLVIGVPLWVAALILAVRLQPRLGILWLLLIAPLIRQFVWVLLPTAIFTFSNQASSLANVFGLSGVTNGSVMISCGNYAVFLAMLVVLLLAGRRLDPSECRTPPALALTGAIMCVVWMYFRLTEQQAGLTQGDPSRFGGSVTYFWGYVGLLLVLARFMPAQAGSLPRRTVLTWFAIALALAAPMLLVGQRMYVIYPLLLASCLVLGATGRRPSLLTLSAWGLGGAAVVLVAFVLLAGIRGTYYWSGALPPLREVPGLLATGIQRADQTLPQIGVRTSTIVLTAEAAAAHSGIFPPYEWGNVLGTLAQSLVTPRLLPASALAAAAGHQGMTPGAWLAMAFGDNSTFTFPPEVAFYLAGGLGAVILGGLLAGVLAAGWVVALQRLRRPGGNVLALVLGVLFSSLMLAELFETVARSLLWFFAITLLTIEAVNGTLRLANYVAAHSGRHTVPGTKAF